MIKKISIIVLIVCLLIALAWQFLTRPEVPTDQGNTVNTFPVTGSNVNPSENDIATTSKILSVKTVDGGTLKVKNFLDDSETIADPQNKDTYYLGNHFSLDGSPQEGEPEYVIAYISTTQYFNIGLFSEPIGASRKHAEEYLLQHLGVTKDQLCTLNYTVSVPYTVNQFLTSRDLRFSFCTGNVPL